MQPTFAMQKMVRKIWETETSFYWAYILSSLNAHHTHSHPLIFDSYWKAVYDRGGVIFYCQSRGTKKCIVIKKLNFRRCVLIGGELQQSCEGWRRLPAKKGWRRLSWSLEAAWWAPRLIWYLLCWWAACISRSILLCRMLFILCYGLEIEKNTYTIYPKTISPVWLME